ncbi:hypothetical protein CYMTET_3916 [Cymbomonas tetramitiformis]|uniref:DUF4336 domain-containing protein n=1 Tax=Cymbomonas tetramitiformis TaxID=36881 RepID=A0AAE0LKK4_9CHLO|nr:hypothetical protein CYMTET_3916 [Cymbomonas tetramitiformis]
MTVIVLKSGGLWVHAPVAPTRECLRVLDELGPVEFVVLPTTAVEHKVFFGPFAKQYPNAQIYAAPGQWSFPLNLPLGWLGLFPRKVDGILQDGDSNTPWSSEIEQAVLRAPLGIAPFVEVAFYHKATRTLLVTDVVIEIPTKPPLICCDNPKPLLVRAKENKEDPNPDTEEVRVRGWQKIVLFALFIKPGSVCFNVGDFLRSDEPFTDCFTWQRSQWIESFSNLQRKLLVPPILQSLVLSKRPTLVKEWVAKICKWNFQQIIPAHFTAPIRANSRDFERAFQFLDEEPASPPKQSWLPKFGREKDGLVQLAEADMKLFSEVDEVLIRSGVVKGERSTT